MLSPAVYYALGCMMEKRLNRHSNALIYGVLLPDLISTVSPKKAGIPYSGNSKEPNVIYVPDPHYCAPGDYHDVPDLERFWQETELTGSIMLGYAAHLIMDKLFVEEFCQYMLFDDSAFYADGGIYEECRRLDHKIAKQFRLDLERLERILNQLFFYIAIDKQKHQHSFDWIDELSTKKPQPRYLEVQPFYGFIEQVADDVLADPEFLRRAHEKGYL